MINKYSNGFLFYLELFRISKQLLYVYPHNVSSFIKLQCHFLVLVSITLFYLASSSLIKIYFLVGKLSILF